MPKLPLAVGRGNPGRGAGGLAPLSPSRAAFLVLGRADTQGTAALDDASLFFALRFLWAGVRARKLPGEIDGHRR